MLSWRRSGDGSLMDARLYLRDEDGRVLSEYLLHDGEEAVLDHEYLYAGARLAAQVDWSGGAALVRYVVVDHLGSTRVVLASDGTVLDTLEYYPYAGLRQGGDVLPTTHLYTGHERDLGETSTQLDYMHARYYSYNLGRFTSIDPVGGKVGLSQGWNRYAYVRGNPVGAVDPDGQALFVVYDFSGSRLDLRTQQAVVHGVTRRFRNAGVTRVYALFAGTSTLPGRSELGQHDAVVRVRFRADSLAEGVFGVTDTSADRSVVDTAKAPTGDRGVVFLINVTSHEVGHGTGALPQYDADSAPKGSLLHPRPAEAGTVMETQVSGDQERAVAILSEEVREFSQEDAAQLRVQLNDPEAEQGLDEGD